MGIRPKFWALFILVALLGNTFAISSAVAKGKDAVLYSKEIEAQAINYLEDKLAFSKYPVELEITFGEKDISIPSKDYSVDFEVTGKLVEMGRNQLLCKIWVDGQMFKKFWISAKTTAIVNVIRPVRPIKRGEIITEEVVNVEQVRAARPLLNTINRLEDIVGTQATHNLQVGRNIDYSSVKRPPLIDQGDRILIVVEKGSMRITTPGLARKGGFKDAVIPVMNLQSNKVIYAKIIDKHTVEVTF